MLLAEILKSVTGDDGYPGDTSHLRALAGRRARHARHPQRALAQVLQLVRRSSTSTPSRRSCGRTATQDIVVADGSPWEMGTLGLARRGARAGRARTRSRRSRWCTQIRAVLSDVRGAAAGASR